MGTGRALQLACGPTLQGLPLVHALVVNVVVEHLRKLIAVEAGLIHALPIDVGIIGSPLGYQSVQLLRSEGGSGRERRLSLGQSLKIELLLCRCNHFRAGMRGPLKSVELG